MSADARWARAGVDSQRGGTVLRLPSHVNREGEDVGILFLEPGPNRRHRRLHPLSLPQFGLSEACNVHDDRDKTRIHALVNLRQNSLEGPQPVGEPEKRLPASVGPFDARTASPSTPCSRMCRSTSTRLFLAAITVTPWLCALCSGKVPQSSASSETGSTVADVATRAQGRHSRTSLGGLSPGAAAHQPARREPFSQRRVSETVSGGPSSSLGFSRIGIAQRRPFTRHCR